MKNIVRYNNVEYFMPFLFCNDIFIPILHKLLENEKNPIKYVYGSPYCEWGIGPRTTVFKLNNLNFVESYLKKLIQKYNIIPAFTFTNLNAKDNLNDEYSNNLLDLAYSLNARFIVSTEELYDHIKSRYSDAKIHSSVILPSIKIIEEKNFDETNFYNQMLDKCEVVVIRPEYIIDNLYKMDKLLSDLSRVEILINQRCQYNCPYHREHYNFQAENDKYGDIQNNKYYDNGHPDYFSLCPNGKEGYRSVMLSDNQVSEAINLGIKKIKIQGRSFKFEMLFHELYKCFFNNENSKEEIRARIDKICADMIENDVRTALFL